MTDRKREQERRAEMWRRFAYWLFYVPNPVIRRQADVYGTSEPLTEDQERISAMWHAYKESERRHLTRITK
jgi:hypothetical protein